MKMNRNLAVAATVVLAAGIVCSGCMRKKREQMKEAVKQMQAAAEQMQKVAPMAQQMEQAAKEMEAAANKAPVEPVDFRELKALLPAELPGLKRTEAAGEKTGAMGMVVSEANARYENDGGASIRIKVQDLGGMSGFAAMAQFGWAMQEVDRETETGYEKTVMIGGNKALEKYDRENKSGDIQVMIKSRFMVEVDGSGIEPAALKDALAKLPMDKLSDLAK